MRGTDVELATNHLGAMLDCADGAACHQISCERRSADSNGPCCIAIRRRGLDRLDPRAAYSAAGAALDHPAEWTSGALETGEFNLLLASGPCYPFGILGATAIQNRLAIGAFRRLRPSTDVGPSEAEDVEWSLTHQPAWVALISGVLVGLLGVASLISSPEAADRAGNAPPKRSGSRTFS